MTQETPAKVLSLLGVAVTAMFFLFAVSSTNASFSGTEYAFPNPFAPEKIVTALDNISSSYSKVADALFLSPVKADLAYYGDTVSWVIDNSDMAILNVVGLQQLAELPADVSEPMVAGAYTESEPQDVVTYESAFSSGGLFSILTGESYY